MAEQILTEISGTEATLQYKIDGVDFKDFGIYVSESSGLIDGLSMKEPQTMNWQGEHGVIVDLVTPRYEQREIEFDCFIQATGKLDFYTKVEAFLKAIQKPSLRKLEVIIASKPLVYMVYQTSQIEVNKRWNAVKMIGEFTVKFIEPSPVKRLLKYTGTSPSITMTTSNPINIFWGDGGQTNDAYGSAITKTHTYSVSGTYYILLTGVIEEISSFTTNALPILP